jgi:hypothetical protein
MWPGLPPRSIEHKELTMHRLMRQPGPLTTVALAIMTGLSAMAGPAAAASSHRPVSQVMPGARLLVAKTAGLVAVRGRSAGPASPPGPAVPSRTVLLINGDRLVLATSPGRSHSVAVLPADPGGLAGSVQAIDVLGQAYEFPAAAVPFLGRGLDPGLFQLSALERMETGGRLPVRLSYQGHLPALPGVTITESGGGTAEGYLTAASAGRFGAALDRQFVADHPRGSYGADGLFSSGLSRPGR